MSGAGAGSRAAPRVLLAPDSFKGTLGAAEVAEAMAAPFEAAGWDVDRCPLADGGEGTTAVLVARLGGELVQAPAHDALGRAITAELGLVEDGRTAIVEAAAASGLGSLDPGELDAEAASSAGTGELLAAAARRASSILVAVGGTATTDGARGALAAIEAAGGLGRAELVCLCDVQTPWERAAAVFAPQKGADGGAVARLAARLERMAVELHRDPRGVPMSGAGGGLAGGLWAALGARLVAGPDFVLDRLGFDRRAAAADLVLTGEGRLDATTLEGKLVERVARRAAARGTPVHVLVGADALADGAGRLGVSSVGEAGTPGALAAATARLARELAALR